MWYRDRVASAAIMVLAFGACAVAPASRPATPAADGGAPVTIASARQYDLTSKINGQTYRLMVFVPPGTDLAKPQPVVYVLDGNWYFGTAADAMGLNQLAGIVVAVGYPTDDPAEIKRRRTLDLSLPNAMADPKYGGGDAFLHVLDDELKPLIAARFKVDPDHQSLFGHSLGGLMVLRELFRNPSAYTTFLACSPSIWWNNRAVLADEPAFTDRIRTGDQHIHLLVTSTADEQYHGDDPVILAKSQKGVRMVDNASELASRLAAVDPAKLAVARQMIAGETHTSGAFASLCRALRFALAAPQH